MKLFYRLFPKDLKITTFNKGWWFYIGLSAAGILLFTICGMSLPKEEKLRMIFVFSVLELIFLRFYKYRMVLNNDDYSYFDNLPCFLCNHSTILCIIASLTVNSHLMAFCIILGTAGSLLAFVYPDKCVANKPFYSFRTFGFYFYHAMLIVSCLSFYTLGLYKKDLMDALWNVLILLTSAVLDHIINIILIKTKLNLDANYDFTIRPDNAFMEILYSFCPKRFLYMVPCLFIAAFLSFVVLLII